MSLVQRANRHIRIRWAGAPLFATGLVLFLFAFQQAMKGGEWFFVLLGMACTLMGLTCFGLNHDTAISLALEARQLDETVEFSDELDRELKEELARDTAGAFALQGNPRLAFFLPVVVILLQITEAYLLFGR